MYDADGERVAKSVGGVTTVYFQGLWEQTAGGASKLCYMFNGQVVAMRDTSTLPNIERSATIAACIRTQST